jgi:DNA-binding response OmpR family regulator
MYRIYLVEDDAALAAEVKKILENTGNEVRVMEDPRGVTEEVRAYDPQLILMDIMLPFQNGYYWTGEIRKFSTVPIVFLSSASDNMNLVMAIGMGGDDFLAKPVDPMVLSAKVQAVLRRSYEIGGNGGSTMEFHGAVLNLNDNTVRIGDSTLDLTKNEFRILHTLLENRGKIVSRDALMLKLWNDDCFVEENTLTVNVTRLRKKLEGVGLADVIITKPGSGYMIS